jgi:hypothetical protein
MGKNPVMATSVSESIQNCTANPGRDSANAPRGLSTIYPGVDVLSKIGWRNIATAVCLSLLPRPGLSFITCQGLL